MFLSGDSGPRGKHTIRIVCAGTQISRFVSAVRFGNGNILFFRLLLVLIGVSCDFTLSTPVFIACAQIQTSYIMSFWIPCAVVWPTTKTYCTQRVCLSRCFPQKSIRSDTKPMHPTRTWRFSLSSQQQKCISRSRNNGRSLCEPLKGMSQWCEWKFQDLCGWHPFCRKLLVPR